MQVEKLLKKLCKELPAFPDGRIDYRNCRESVVVNVFVMQEEKLLILKRSNKVGNYKRYWNVVAGYYDEIKEEKVKALEELKEETGIGEENIKEILVKEIKKITDRKVNKIFYVIPVLVRVVPNCKVEIDWEHTEFKWIDPSEIGNFKTVHGLQEMYEYVINE